MVCTCLKHFKCIWCAGTWTNINKSNWMERMVELLRELMKREFLMVFWTLILWNTWIYNLFQRRNWILIYFRIIYYHNIWLSAPVFRYLIKRSPQIIISSITIKTLEIVEFYATHITSKDPKNNVNLSTYKLKHTNGQFGSESNKDLIWKRITR